MTSRNDPIMRDDRPMTQILVADSLRSRFCCHFPIGRAVIVLRDLFPTHPGRSVRLLARHCVLFSWRLVYLRFGAQLASNTHDAASPDFHVLADMAVTSALEVAVCPAEVKLQMGAVGIFVS